MLQLNTIDSTVNKGDRVVFIDEWQERQLFGYSEYEITFISHAARFANVKELSSNHTYLKVGLKELRTIN